MSGTVDQRTSTVPVAEGSLSETRLRLSEHFDFVRCLGRGGAGEVWEARQRSVGGRRVAVKMLHEHQSSSVVVVERLYREARALAAIEHPHVVKVLDVVRRDDGLPCLVQEYLDGESLRARMQHAGPMSIPVALGVLVPVLDALQAAHALGILHRDIKPENILLAAGDRGETLPYVIDFGVARLEGANEVTLTSRSRSPGTPGYMAPEQVRRAQGDVLDARVDVWSTALVLWEMLAGRHPFAKGPEITMLMRPCLEDVLRIDAAVPATPASLGDALAKALVRDRGSRTASAAEFIAALLDGQPWSSEPWCEALRVRYGSPAALGACKYAGSR